MKKQIKFIILLIVVSVLVVVGVKGKKYYSETYVGSEYYIKVPEDQDMTLETLRDMNNKKVGKGKEYSLKAYNTDGDMKIAEFDIRGDDASGLLQPNSYLRAEISEKRVIKQEVIPESEVPDKVLQVIEENSK